MAVVVGKLQIAAIPILLGVACLAGAVIALRLATRLQPHRAFAAGLVLAAFSVADLRWNNGPNESTGLPPAEYEALRTRTGDDTVALLKAELALAARPDRRDRVELVGIGYHWPNIGLVHGFEHLFGHNPLRLKTFQDTTHASDTLAGPDQRVFSPLLPSFRSTLEDLFGVRFIAIGVPIERVDPALKPGDLRFIAQTRNAYVYENPRAFPRVMVADRWQTADFADMVKTGYWPEADLKRTVLLERAPDDVPTDAGAAGTARIASYKNVEVVAEAEAPKGGFLVLYDVWHPWWRATVDGKPADILKADVLFRAVALPPGKHEVRFTFHPFAGAVAEVRDKLAGR